jgi:hypothetical protein
MIEIYAHLAGFPMRCLSANARLFILADYKPKGYHFLPDVCAAAVLLVCGQHK